MSTPIQQRALDTGTFLARVPDVSKVTNKLQITLPKKLADRVGIKAGDEVQLEVLDDTIRVIPEKKRRSATNDSRSLSLRFFDQATRRQRKLEKALDPGKIRSTKAARGWTRDQLYNPPRH